MMKEQKKKRLTGIVVVIILLLAIVVVKGVVIVDETEVAVKTTLGKVSDEELYSGPHIIIPFAQKVVKYPKKVQEIDFTATPFTSEGLEVQMDVSVFYKIQPEHANDVYKLFKTDYNERLQSIAMAIVREVVTQYSSEDLYKSETRQELASNLTKKMQEEFSKYYFDVVKVNVKNIQLPEEVVKSIEAKIQAKQEAERYQYLLEKERLEAERKRVEAQGIADANKIIAESIDDNYIKWYYMETLKEFAESNNNAIIVVPVPASYYENVNLTEPIQPPMVVNIGGSSGGTSG